MYLLKGNHYLHDEIRPLLRGYVHTYNYSDLEDFSLDHREKLIGELIGCNRINKQLFQELICFDEFVHGVCMGYIQAEEMKRDLMDRITDVVWDELDQWVQEEYRAESNSQSKRGDDVNLSWESEMQNRADDHNKFIYCQGND